MINSELSPGLGLKRPYEDGAMDDKDLIKKMKRNLRKGTRRKEMKNNGRVSYPDCSLCFSFCFFPSFSVGKSFFPMLP